ncbi:MAG: chemotaxis protein CheA [Paracoccaceae bacterium]
MVNTNKILTVSYGTFSCTLEGFDDAFGTMKAIAEYFRDLAADDRYFGAEPPTPDAEMLARIAEREIARRVEARLDNDKVHLRADPASILPVAALDAAASADADEIEAVEEETPAVAQPVAEAPAAPAAAPAAAVETAEDEAYWAEDQEDVVFPDISDDLTQAAGEMVANAPVIATDALDEDADETAYEPSLAWPDTEAASFFETAPQPAADTVESVAAKLSRIRAVVSQERAAAATDYSEDEHAEDFVAQDLLAETHEDIEAALAVDDAAETARTETWEDEDAQAETGTDDIAALIDRYTGLHHHSEAAAESAEDEAEDDTYETAAYEAESAEDDFEDDLEAVQDETAEIEAEPVEDEDEDDLAEFDSEESLFVPGDEDTLFDDDAIAVEDDAETGYEPEPAETAIRARVIKMKRADFEAAIASGEIEEEEDNEDATSLSPEDEADLLRELAAVEAELDADDAADEADEMADEDEAEDASYIFAEDDADESDEGDNTIDLSAFIDSDEDEDEDRENAFAAEPETEAETDYFEDDEDEDAPVSSGSTRFKADAESEMARMFDMADSQMDEEAGKGRRNAIAHLRAAVAAAKAEGGKIRTHGPDTEAYRDDLDSVVRPRRPEAGATHTRRPNPTRPAPLKLVAEQRVDLDTADSQAPIRPRRVNAPAVDLTEVSTGHDGDFADYAENVGANTLPELLEAAAAYLSFVEGREQFSRPQLMTQVRQAEPEEFSREDGLRSFGQLLREGKIEKLEGGRFKASESISYRPSKRYAGE